MSVAPQRIQPLPRSLTRRREVPRLPSKKNPKWNSMGKPLRFKLYAMFIEINEDGILLSDYTHQSARHVEWNTMSIIMDKL